MSYRTLSTKPLNASLKTLLKRGGHIGLGLSAFTPVLALANPTGGQVAAGQASIAAHGANGMVITQSSQSAIINWQQFNIGAGQYVQFLQPSSSSVVLNRVIGGSPSSILGSLTGNGQVFLVNTNGVYFGKGSSIDTQGFLASTLGITDQNFLAHDYVFNQAGAAGATVVNDGSITAHHSGYVVLAGDYAENDGVIAAQSGHVILASGAKAILSLNGNSLINFAVNQSTLANYAGVKNAGSILADGGTVIMTADVANLLKSTVVNNTGLVEAHAISNSGGVIQLLATGGNIQNAGTLDASGIRAGQAGGAITLKGDARTTLTDASKIVDTGDGANGGHVEVSGETIGVRGVLDLGHHGALLLDPSEITIVAGGGSNLGGTLTGTMGVGLIEKLLNSGNPVTIVASSIHANSSVHAISATKTAAQGGGGNLSLKTSNIGQINLSGVDINIAGKLSASMHSGGFGHITAGSVDLNATGTIKLSAATVSKGAVTTWSAKTTGGDLSIQAAKLQMLDSSSNATLALSAQQQLDLTTTRYGSSSAAAKGNLVLAGASVRAQDSVFITGKFTATATDGHANFSDVFASGGIKISVTGGNLGVSGQLRDRSTGSGITLKDAGGSLSVGINVAYGGDVNITDTGSGHNVRLYKGILAYAGNVTVDAGAQDLLFGSNSSAGIKGVMAEKAISLTAKGIAFHGTSHVVFDVQAYGGDIIAHGAIGSNGGVSFAGNGGVELIATDGKVTLDHGIQVNGSVDISAKSLVYTGTGNFGISALGGDLVLDAAIGTVKAPAKYAVDLKASGGNLDIERSIFTTKGISAVESSGTAGVFVQNSDATAITLSAKGAISIQGDKVTIGGTAPVTITADDGNAATTTDDLTIQAGRVTIGGSDISANNQSFAAVTVDHSVTLHAGHDVLIGSGSRVSIGGADVSAAVHSNGGAVTAKADVSISAGHNIDIIADEIHLQAGSALARVQNDRKATATATAEANLSLSAGNDVSLQASSHSFLVISGGSAKVTATTDVAKQKISATASAGVSIKAGHDMTLSGDGINIVGGKDAASGAQVIAAQSGAKATAAAHADTILSAGDAISVTGHEVTVGAGIGAAGAQSSATASAGHHQVTWSPTQVSATGQKAAASLTATANVSLKAGAGGIALDAGSGGLNVAAGEQAALAVQVDAGSLGGKASVDAEAKLSLAASGDVSLTATDNLHVRGGTSAGGVALSLSSSLHGTSVTRSVTGRQAASLHAGAGGTASLKTDVSVSITAGGAVSLADTNLAGPENLNISAGVRPAGSIGVFATGAKAVANVTLDTAVSLSAGKGGLTVETHTNSGGMLQIFAGAVGSAAQIAKHASVSADFGAKAGLAIDSRVVLSTKGDLVLAARSEVEMEGGSHGFQSAVVHASSGTATASLQDGVALTAGGVFAANASSIVGFIGAQHQAQSDSVSAVGTGAKAALSADGRISLNAGGGFNFGAEFFAASAGRHIGSGADITGSAGGSATLTAKAGISFIGGGDFTLNVGGSGNLHIIGGFGGQDDVTATHGKAALNQDGSVLISVTGNLDLLAPAVTIAAGSGAVGASDHVSVTRGSAMVTGLDGIALKAGKEFVASGAGSGLSIFAGQSAGADVTMSARGPASKISMQTAAGVSIAAGTDVTLKGHGRFILFAGDDALRLAHISASSGAVVTDSANARLDFTAAGAFLASAHSANLQLETGSFTTEHDTVDVKHGSVTLKGDAGLHVTAKSTLSLVGAGSGNLLAGKGAGSHGVFTAIGGAINATALTDLSLTAGGALHLDFGGSLGIGGVPGQAAAADNKLDALGTGTKMNLLANAGISLTGGDISLVAANDVALDAASDVFRRGSIHADSGGVVSEAGLDGLNFKTGGAFSVDAGGTLTIKGGSQAAQSLSIEAAGPGAKATVLADASVSVSAGSVALTGDSLDIFGGNAAASNADVLAGSAGGNAKLTAQAGMGIKASGTVTLTGNSMNLTAGGLAARNGLVEVSGAKAAAAFAVQSTLAISGKTVTITDAGVFSALAGNQVGDDLHASAADGGATTVSVGSQLSITASGVLSVSAKAGSLIRAGSSVAASEHLDATQGKLSVAVTSGTALTAGGNLTLDMGGASLTMLAGLAGSSQQVSAGAGGIISNKTDVSLVLKSGAKLTLSNITGLIVDAGARGSGSLPAVTTVDGGKVGGLVDESISILGKSVATSNVTGFVHNSLAGFTDDGLVFKTTITVSGGVGVLDFQTPAPMDLGTLQQDALNTSLKTVLSAPQTDTAPTLFTPQLGSVTFRSADCQATLSRSCKSKD